MSDELKAQIVEMARKCHIEEVGITPASRLDGAPEGYKPRDYLANVKNVIVLGCHFPEASALTWEQSLFSYQYYCYALVNKELGHAAFRISKVLEDAGYLALPMVPTVYVKDMDYHKKFGEISHRHAAVAAGLADFGISGNVIHPKYGTRIRFVSILTSADLPPSDMLDGEPLCNSCMKCVKICPPDALRDEFRESFVIEGKKFEINSVDKNACMYHILGHGPGAGGLIRKPLKKKTSGRLTTREFNWSLVKSFFSKPGAASIQLGMQMGVDWVDYCGRCLHVCNPNPNGLK